MEPPKVSGCDRTGIAFPHQTMYGFHRKYLLDSKLTLPYNRTHIISLYRTGWSGVVSLDWVPGFLHNSGRVYVFRYSTCVLRAYATPLQAGNGHGDSYLRYRSSLVTNLNRGHGDRSGH